MTREAFPTNADHDETTVQFATGPRYLAGGGDPRRVTEVLRAAGWSNYSDPNYPHVLLASTDLASRLTLEPSAPDPHAAWWRFNASGWYAHFGGHTPAEILAGFCDALVKPGPEQPLTGADIREVLASTGWGTDGVREGSESAVSPDGYVRMGPHPALDGDNGWPTWCAEAALDTGTGGHQRVWSAWFSPGTPAHLIAGFAAQLVDPAPVYRGSHRLPHPRLVTQEPTTVQGEQLATEHRQWLYRVRAAVRKQHKAAATLRARAPVTPAADNTPPAVRR